MIDLILRNSGANNPIMRDAETSGRMRLRQNGRVYFYGYRLVSNHLFGKSTKIKLNKN